MNESQSTIKDIVFAQHYAKRISGAVHAQVMNFAQSMTHQMLSVHPEGSPEYMAVVHALERTGLVIARKINESSSAPLPEPVDESDKDPDMQEISKNGAVCSEVRSIMQPTPSSPSQSVLKGPWTAR